MYTIFVVFVCGFPCLSVIRIFNPDLDFTLESATYNWPWENTGLGRNKPTFSSVWPWFLLIVIAKANVTGNCLQRILKENFVSGGVTNILGIQTASPEISLPVIILPCITWGNNWVTISLVPLHKPSITSMLRRHMIGAPSFKQCLGSLATLTLFKNYVGYTTFSSMSTSDGIMLSELR